MPDIAQIIGIIAIGGLLYMAWRHIFEKSTYVSESGKWRASWYLVTALIISMAIW